MARKKNNIIRLDVLDWLKKQGITQADWARTLGLPAPTIHYWIHQGKTPKAIYLDRIKERTPDCPLLKDADVLKALTAVK